MKADDLMCQHAEVWVRLLTLERDWGTPRDLLLQRAMENRNMDLPTLNERLKGWQKNGKPLEMQN